jgi:uncharacterized membrane protein
MVELGSLSVPGHYQIVLSPNGSLTRGQLSLLIIATAIVMFGIAFAFALMGLWLILPFSGLEWLALAYCLLLSYRFSGAKEIITITDATVTLQKGAWRLPKTYEFQRAWVALQIRKPIWRGHPSRLSLRLHGRDIEIGRFLVETERLQLAGQLKELLPTKMVST